MGDDMNRPIIVTLSIMENVMHCWILVCWILFRLGSKNIDSPKFLACEPDVYYSLINYAISNYRQYVSHTFYTVVLCPPEWVIEIGVRKPWPYVLSIKVTVDSLFGRVGSNITFFQKGEWNEETSGGCLNEETFEDNTFYLLTLPKSVPRHAHLPLCIMLEQKSHTNQPEVPGQIIPYPYYIGFYVFNAGRCKKRIVCHARSLTYFLNRAH